MRPSHCASHLARPKHCACRQQSLPKAEGLLHCRLSNQCLIRKCLPVPGEAARADLTHLSWWGARVKRGSSCMRDSAAANVTSAGGRSSCWPCAADTGSVSVAIDSAAPLHQGGRSPQRQCHACCPMQAGAAPCSNARQRLCRRFEASTAAGAVASARPAPAQHAGAQIPGVLGGARQAAGP